MLVPPPPHLLPPHAAVLLVLLPRAAGGQPAQAPIRARLDALQHRLGPAIRLLVVDEENDPAVVRSFRMATLPAFLLVQQGIELWRQPGLPEGEVIAEQLLHRLRQAGGPPAPNHAD